MNILAGGVELLRRAFNRDAECARLLILVSPT
jgi:hypothetical protein